MQLKETRLPGVFIIEPRVFGDERGWFMESFNERDFQAALAAAGQPPPPTFVQDNHSCSHKGVLRGLHYQLPPHAQGKLMRVVSGRAHDVVVDIRRGSPSFGQWLGVELDAASANMLWVPAGFAHGFMVLEDNTQLLYKTTDYYAKAAERAIRWNDPALAIDWPDMAVIINARDAAAPLLAEAELA